MNEEIESIANNIIENYHIHTPVTRTDIDTLVKACGLKFKFVNSMDYPKLDYDDNDNPVIVIDRYYYERLDDSLYYRTDVLYEIGKYLLPNVDDFVLGDIRYGYFTRAILMPKNEYLQFVKGKSYADLEKIANHFNVPQLEVINRGVDLGVIRFWVD